MIHEIQEFLDYTTPVVYTAEGNKTAYLRRFTMEFFSSFEGLPRVLTVIARGYLFQHEEPDIDRARRALLAWSSIPESKKATSKKEWQYGTDFRGLHEEFPELVDAKGQGWLYRHAHGVVNFALKNPDLIDARKLPRAEKVVQLQNRIFNLKTKGGWVFRFDDAIAEALELGPLQNHDITLPEELVQRIEKTAPKKQVPYIRDLICYYLAYRREDTDWVVLPATCFDNYYRSSYFSKKVQGNIPKEILIRQERSGISRYRVMEEYLP